MKTINLRDYYPFYTADLFIEVPDEVLEVFDEAERDEGAYRRRMFRHKAHYSLDTGDGIEHEALFVSLTPCELYERKLTMEQLYAALDSLPGKQGRRIYAYFILGISQKEIAKAEGVGKSTVSESIERGLRGMESFLKKCSDDPNFYPKNVTVIGRSI